jgi:hypothetical protein
MKAEPEIRIEIRLGMVRRRDKSKLFGGFPSGLTLSLGLTDRGAERLQENHALEGVRFFV